MDAVPSLGRSLQCGSAGRNRQPPAAAKRLRAHFQERRSLSPLEFGALQQPLNSLHQLRIMAGLHQRFGADALLDQGSQQGIEFAVVGQRVTVLLIRPQLGTGGFAPDRQSHQLPLRR